MKIKLITDSSSDFDKDEAMEKGVELVPMEITIDNKQYLDGENLTKNEFYEKLEKCEDFPKTSQVNEFRWNEVFEKFVNEGYNCIVITISSGLSGTYNSAVSASKNFEGKVFVVDSLNASLGQRVLIEYAIELINKGEDIEKIVELLNENKKRIVVDAVLGTLKYLKKGGRISPLVAFAGEILNIKPEIAVIDGKIELTGKIKGFKNGLNHLTQKTKEKGIDLDMPFNIVYSGNDRTIAEKYIEQCEEFWLTQCGGDINKISINQMGSTVGVHIGPGTIGVAYFKKEK